MTTAVVNLADTSRPSPHRVRRGQILMIALMAAVSLVVLLQAIPTSPDEAAGPAERWAGISTLLMFVGVAVMTLVAVAAGLISAARRSRY